MNKAEKPIDLDELFHVLSYTFIDISLLQLALTHRSVSQYNNERLELLGDAVLSFVITDALYKASSSTDEGELSRQRSYLVCEKTLSRVAQELTIPSYLILTTSEIKTGGQMRPSILSDALEAIIAAIYLDGGIEVCRSCVLKWYASRLTGDLFQMATKDPKTQLQEYTQAHSHVLPCYEIIEVCGKQHHKKFHVRCTISGISFVGEGSGHSRREAEKEAAQHYLEQLKIR